MKSIGIIEKLKGFSKRELILLGVILSIFLPFYLFLIIFISYLIGLVITGEMKGILKNLSNHFVLLLFIAYSGGVSLLAQNLMGMVATLAMFLFAIFFYYYQAHLTPKFFRFMLQGILSLSMLASVFAALEHFQIVKKFDYTFLSPKMQVW